MSPDSFFSAVLLRSLHPSAPLRHDLLQEKTQRFLRQHSLSPATSSSDKNPLFTFAATYLKTVQDSRIVFVSIYVRAIRALPGPVLRTANMYFQHTATGNPKRYLAVSTAHDICSNCFPVNASATIVPCKPPCTSRHCTRCNYYGHNGPWCLQTHTTSGVPVPQNTAAPGMTKVSRQFSHLLPRMTTNTLTLV